MIALLGLSATWRKSIANIERMRTCWWIPRFLTTLFLFNAFFKFITISSQYNMVIQLNVRLTGSLNCSVFLNYYHHYYIIIIYIYFFYLYQYPPPEGDNTQLKPSRDPQYRTNAKMRKFFI